MGNREDDYLKGYESGMKDALNEAIRLIARGYTSREVQIILKGRLATLYQQLETKRLEVAAPGPSRASSDSIYLRSFGAAPAVQSGPMGGLVARAAHEEEAGPLKRGSYIVQEERYERSFEIFSELVGSGVEGLAIVRQMPRNIRAKYGKLGGVKMIWLTKMKAVDGASGLMPSGLGLGGGLSDGEASDEELSPTNLSNFTVRVSDFLKTPGDKAIILEGLGYLITENNFEQIIRLVGVLKDAVAKKNGYLIMPFDPTTTDPKEYSQIKREVDFELRGRR